MAEQCHAEAALPTTADANPAFGEVVTQQGGPASAVPSSAPTWSFASMVLDG